MRITKDTILGIATLALVFGGFQYCAVKAKERQWFFFRGDKDYIMFADILNKEDGYGHLLTVDQDSKVRDMELDVTWTCAPPKISFPEGWTVESDLNQLERASPPRDWQEPHAPKNAMEQQFLQLACQNTGSSQVFKLQAKQVPAVLARKAFKLVEDGMAPHLALQMAARGK
jgi:hypothetical protein